MVDEPPVGTGGRVVELVDDDVVEVIEREPVEVVRAPEGLNGSEEDISVRLPLREPA